MRLFSKGEIDYEKPAIKAIMKQGGIFSYQTTDGELKVNFSVEECMHYWEVRVPVAELLNHVMDKVLRSSMENFVLASVTETGNDIIQAMRACAVKNGTVKRRIFSIVAGTSGLNLRSEDGSVDPAGKKIILVETSIEKINWVLEDENNFLGVRKIILLFGGRHKDNGISALARKRGIETYTFLPLEKLVLEYLKVIV